MASPSRKTIATLALSAVGFCGILAQEGYFTKASIPVPGDVPTIGFGTTENVRMGDTITPPKAVARALRDVSKYEKVIRKAIKVPLHQYEYDAFVDTAYNIGPEAFRTSSMARLANQEDYYGACNAILLWKKYKQYDCSLAKNSRICGGLWTRRLEMTHLCLTGEYPNVLGG